MRIVLARPRGFCAGVRMAIECVEQALAGLGPPVYVFHEIVHNRHVVDHFARAGAVFVDDIADVPQGAPIVFSAHGVSPEVRRQAAERGLVQIDATCPLVNKVHAEAARYARQGRAIILIGHRDHDEVIGTVGEAPEATHVVGSAADVAALQIPPDQPIVYLMQTTLSVDDAADIVAAVRRKYPHAQPPPGDDICYATTNRQLAVRELAPQCDLTLVVGSRNSSNSMRLVEVARNQGVSAHLINDVGEINPAWLQNVESVFVTAGASAPEHLVQEVIRSLVRQYGATVEEREAVHEPEMHFELPLSLRRLPVLAQIDRASARSA